MAVHARVLRIARSDAEVETSLLLHVSSNGPSSLDLQLVATEGVHPYVGSVQHGRVSALRAKNAMVTDDEWETVLSTLLRSSGRDQEARRGIEGVEMTASVTEGVDATVTIRKNVGGITQRLGTISLGHDEAQEIELFDWAGLAAEEASSARVDVMALMTRYRAQEKQVQQLTRQLDDLIKAKKEHEDTLLQKCRELLNRKKLKIRDQQRLLQGAILDPVRGIHWPGGAPFEADEEVLQYLTFIKPSKKSVLVADIDWETDGRMKAPATSASLAQSILLKPIDEAKFKQKISLAAYNQRKKGTPTAPLSSSTSTITTTSKPEVVKTNSNPESTLFTATNEPEAAKTNGKHEFPLSTATAKAEAAKQNGKSELIRYTATIKLDPVETNGIHKPTPSMITALSCHTNSSGEQKPTPSTRSALPRTKTSEKHKLPISTEPAQSRPTKMSGISKAAESIMAASSQKTTMNGAAPTSQARPKKRSPEPFSDRPSSSGTSQESVHRAKKARTVESPRRVVSDVHSGRAKSPTAKTSRPPHNLPPLLSPTLPPVIEEELRLTQSRPPAQDHASKNPKSNGTNTKPQLRKTPLLPPSQDSVSKLSRPSAGPPSAKSEQTKAPEAKANGAKPTGAVPKPKAGLTPPKMVVVLKYGRGRRKDVQRILIFSPRTNPASVGGKRPRAPNGEMAAEPPAKRQKAPETTAAPDIEGAKTPKVGRNEGAGLALVQGKAFVPAETGRAPELEGWRAEHVKYLELGRKTKHESQEVLRTSSTEGAAVEERDQKLGALLGLESVLCWFLAFAALDEVGRLNRKGGEAANWQSTLPFWRFVEGRCREFPQLHGLCLQLGAVCHEVIHGLDMERLRKGELPDSRAGPELEHEVAAVRREYTQWMHEAAKRGRDLRRLWADGQRELAIDDLIDDFPQTWAKRGRGSRTTARPTPADHDAVTFHLPLMSVSTPWEAVSAATSVLTEWAQREGVVWESRLG
ncbi:MAG: hypothetical protein M1838_002021 [Thelocarpon superellum]|nr:MAG: hypothetical protein M1838_002021 [Thelocarpon superellum]